MTRTARRTEEGVDNPDPLPTNPAAARRRLGAELRMLREAADLKLDAPAGRLQRSTATVSRLETGKSRPREVDIRALIAFYREQVPDAVTAEVETRILRLADEARKKGWLSTYDDVISGEMTPAHMRYFVDLESAASEIRSYEPDLVPGLLQTRAYADVLAQVFFPASTPAQRKRLVDFRMARAQVLERPRRLRFRVVVGQNVLRRPVGGPSVMREQLTALREYAVGDEFTNVDLRVAPDDLVSPTIFGGPFLLMFFPDELDQNLVYLEGRTGETYLESDDDVGEYGKLFERLSAEALDQERSAELLDQAIDVLR